MGYSEGWGDRVSWKGPEAGVCWSVKEIRRVGAGCWRERAQEMSQGWGMQICRTCEYWGLGFEICLKRVIVLPIFNFNF